MLTFKDVEKEINENEFKYYVHGTVLSKKEIQNINIDSDDVLRSAKRALKKIFGEKNLPLYISEYRASLWVTYIDDAISIGHSGIKISVKKTQVKYKQSKSETYSYRYDGMRFYEFKNIEIHSFETNDGTIITDFEAYIEHIKKRLKMFSDYELNKFNNFMEILSNLNITTFDAAKIINSYSMLSRKYKDQVKL